MNQVFEWFFALPLLLLPWYLFLHNYHCQQVILHNVFRWMAEDGREEGLLLLHTTYDSTEAIPKITGGFSKNVCHTPTPLLFLSCQREQTKSKSPFCCSVRSIFESRRAFSPGAHLRKQSLVDENGEREREHHDIPPMRLPFSSDWHSSITTCDASYQSSSSLEFLVLS